MVFDVMQIMIWVCSMLIPPAHSTFPGTAGMRSCVTVDTIAAAEVSMADQ